MVLLDVESIFENKKCLDSHYTFLEFYFEGDLEEAIVSRRDDYLHTPVNQENS